MNNQERIDDLQIKGYKIIQNPQLFCFGMDAVLLSAFARVGEAETALDLGCGNGIIPLLLAAKTKGQHFTGLEIQEESVNLAKRSIALNGLEDKIQVIKGDIKEASTIFGASSFSVITSNPPYMIGAHGLTSDKEALNIARHEVLCTLSDVIREGSRLLKEKGRFYMVHRPFRLPEILAEMQKQRIEPKRMRLVYPYVHKEPNMVLIEGVKGGRPRMQVEPPLIVYEENGNYTKELLKLYGEVE
ncbi:tRNA1Val (adenine37-N6)-methyltransferase [Lachnospiraceae bacterium PM6-15]|uniref:tRNA1(Val) (Adenine(37)-N6)-methyltransferase n=1 Tax=Ohessyouella blattaphilus TaxID=2949333 RepID=A0ABT1EK44_9FIRM|nr:tRNA1(Val) (adenine(37)-N6)-methyltransferase [Ohessyouella blattaphilus]MCP1110041.1 tRNA1(Val) (adenine(37)-N6)-methyltransferase [Ohessyouella blattaphilus]MCR8563435.1 tRNA1(Val) (adenine(37)-N6)-methyltransferase [Ohessyouella blattaphilus]